MTEAAAFVAWLGGAIIVLADGRRGLAIGMMMLAAAMATFAFAAGQDLTAAVLIAGGLVGSALRLRAGPDGWGLMQPGSTPRIILTIVVALICLYLAVSIATGDGAPLRFAVMVVLVLAGARLLLGSGRAAALTASSGLALALAAGALLAGDALPAGVAGALIAAGTSALPVVESHGA